MKDLREQKGNTPGELGEKYAKKEAESLVTNFPTIALTREAIKDIAQMDLDDIGELYNIFKELARGKDPEKVINNESFVAYKHMVEVVENGFALIEEYRADINSLRLKETEEEWVYLTGDLRVKKPIRTKLEKHFGYQEIAERDAGRWEGYVSLILTEREFDRRIKEYQDNL